MNDPFYGPVLEAIAHADEALEFLKEGYDPEFVAQRARTALFEVEAVLRDWEPTFKSDGLRGTQLRNRLLSSRVDLLRVPALADELIKRREAEKDRGEGVTYGEYGARTLGGALRDLTKNAGPITLGLGAIGAALIVVAILVVKR